VTKIQPDPSQALKPGPTKLGSGLGLELWSSWLGIELGLVLAYNWTGPVSGFFPVWQDFRHN